MNRRPSRGIVGSGTVSTPRTRHPVNNGNGQAFADSLAGRAADVLDACTRCGKCVEVCPMVEPAGLDAADAPGIVSGVTDLLAGGEGTGEAATWANVCTGSGYCIPACPHGVNPRFMLGLARTAARRRQGEEPARRDGAEVFSGMSRGGAGPFENAASAGRAREDQPAPAARRAPGGGARRRFLHRVQRAPHPAHRAPLPGRPRHPRGPLRGDGRAVGLLRDLPVPGGGRRGRGPGRLQHHRATRRRRHRGGALVVPELPDPARGGHPPDLFRGAGGRSVRPHAVHRVRRRPAGPARPSHDPPRAAAGRPARAPRPPRGGRGGAAHPPRHSGPRPRRARGAAGGDDVEQPLRAPRLQGEAPRSASSRRRRRRGSTPSRPSSTPATARSVTTSRGGASRSSTSWSSWARASAFATRMSTSA